MLSLPWLLPFLVGFIAVPRSGLSPRERAVLALALIRNDAEAQHYRRWRRIGVATHSVGLVLGAVAVTGLVLLGQLPLAAVFACLVLVAETYVLRTGRTKFCKYVEQCDAQDEVL